ncbi:hypothetical protein [Staphylococcus phage vB_SsapH-Golestan-100]|nr:hypothetical protein [Staphylococcus phage vB_SsapH-Golestan-100]
MKLYLNSNIAEGTPEELVTYKELLKERGLDSEKSLFHFGHMHQPTEEEADEQEVDNSVYDKGAFYTVTEEAEDSPLPVGAILQHLHGRIFSDSKGQQCIISRPSFVDRGNTHWFDDSINQDRFELAKQLGIQLTDTTDLAQATEGKYFKVTEEHSDLSVGDLVTIAEDDRDNLPQCKDKHGNFYYVYLGDLELVEDNSESTLSSTDEAETPSTELKVGDRVKVLKSEGGAVGEATVTAVLEDGDVRLEGKSDSGVYSYRWSNNISNLEKVKEKPASFGAIQAKAYLEDKSIDQVIEEVQSKHKQESDNARVEEEIYAYYEVVDPDVFASSVEKGTVFKVIGNTYTLLNQEGKDREYINVVTSTGLTQTSPLRDSVIKPIINDSFIAERFKFAKEVGIVLAVDTDFEEECKDHHFKVTEEEPLSNFTPTDILTVRRDDNTNAIAFQDRNGKTQYTLLVDVREIARPSK